MNKTYVKVFLRKETTVVECLELIKELRNNHFVENARICSKIFPETNKNIKQPTLAQWRLQKKYKETERMLKLLKEKGSNN